MLKLDDYGGDNTGFQRVLDHLAERKIKSSVGVICKNLEKSPDNPKYLRRLRDR